MMDMTKIEEWASTNKKGNQKIWKCYFCGKQLDRELVYKIIHQKYDRRAFKTKYNIDLCRTCYSKMIKNVKEKN